MEYTIRTHILMILCLCMTFFLPTQVQAVDEDGGDIVTFMDGRATLYYYSGIDKDVAEWVQGAIEKAWPMYTAQSGKELTKLDIQIGHLMMRNEKTNLMEEPYGVASYIKDTYTCEVTISTVKSEKEIIEATTVHELMHCWQFDMDWPSYKEKDSEWIMEATAVWTEDWIYEYDTEFEYLPSEFSSFPIDFFSTKGNQEYGSYLYFKFLRQNNLITPKGVFDLLKQMKTTKQEKIIASQSNLKTILKKYALWNLNFGIFQKYKDTPKFKKIGPYGDSKTYVHIKKDINESFIDFSLYRGGTQYNVVFIPDNIQKLKFDTEKFNTLAHPNIALQAVIKINGQWEYEDWSFLKERTFCRNRASEKVDMLILFATKTNLDTLNQLDLGAITADSRGECPVQWSGKTIFKKTGGANVVPIEETLIMDEILEIVTDEDGDIDFYIKEQTVTVDGKSGINSPCLFTGCSGDMGHTTTYNGSTHRTMPDDEEWPISRFSSAGDGHVFIGTDQLYGDCDYVQETTESFSTCSCPNMGSSIYSNTTTDENSCHNGPNYEVDIPIIYIPGETKRIQGSTNGNSPAGHYTETITWDYVYE